MSTIPHFWLMVWEQNSSAILMLNKLVEERHTKCHMYWPDKKNPLMELKEVGLSIEYKKTEYYKSFCKRTFR